MEKNKEPTKPNAIIVLLIAIAVISMNGLYLEYFVAREMPLFLSTIVMVLVVIIDIYSLIKLIKLVKTILKF